MDGLVQVIAAAVGGSGLTGAVVGALAKYALNAYVEDRKEFERETAIELQRLRLEFERAEISRARHEADVDARLASKNGKDLEHLVQVVRRLREEHDRDHAKLGEVHDYVVFAKAREEGRLK